MGRQGQRMHCWARQTLEETGLLDFLYRDSLSYSFGMYFKVERVYYCLLSVSSSCTSVICATKVSLSYAFKKRCASGCI